MNEADKTKAPGDIDVRAETDDDLNWTGRWTGYAGGETGTWNSIDEVLAASGVEIAAMARLRQRARQWHNAQDRYKRAEAERDSLRRRVLCLEDIARAAIENS